MTEFTSNKINIDKEKVTSLLKSDTYKTRIIQGPEAYDIDKITFYLANHIDFKMKESDNITIMGINDTETRNDVLEENNLEDKIDEEQEEKHKQKDEVDIIYKLSKNKYYLFEYNDTGFVIYLENDNNIPARIKHKTDILTSMYIFFNDEFTVFEDLCEEAYLYFEKHFLRIENNSESLNIYLKAEYGFDKTNTIKKKKESTLYLPKKQIKKLIDDFQYFLDNETLYNFLDINYKRCYLFEGVWGSGKTSTIRMLASKFKYNIAIIAFDTSLTDTKFFDALRDLPRKSILVLEDIDCLFQERKKNDENKNMVTFSSILNALDGMLTKHGLVTIMTTNYKINLDKALIRPGRVDYIMHFDYMKKTEIKTMYLRFVYVDENIQALKEKEEETNTNKLELTSKEEKNKTFEQFYNEYKKLQIKLTASLFQQFLWIYVNNPQGSIDNIDTLKDLYDDSNLDGDKNLYT